MNEETSLCVSELIRLFAAALRDLNEGEPIPKEWRREISDALGFGRRTGRPVDPAIRERDREIAHRTLQHIFAREGHETTESLAAFYERLSDELKSQGHSVEPENIAVIARRRRTDARITEVWLRLDRKDEEKQRQRRERGERIRARLNAGESLEDILKSPNIPFGDFKAIREHQTRGASLEGRSKFKPAPSYAERRAQIVAWINEGMGRHIDAEPLPVSILNRSHEVPPVRLRRDRKKHKSN